MELDNGYMCASCGKTNEVLSKMRLHLATHGINNQHPCPFCARVSTTEDGRRKQAYNESPQEGAQLQADPRISSI